MARVSSRGEEGSTFADGAVGDQARLPGAGPCTRVLLLELIPGGISTEICRKCLALEQLSSLQA